MTAEAQPLPASRLSRFAQRFILTYKERVSPNIGARCRFEPTCSEYGLEAFRRYGFFRAAAKTSWRLVRCSSSRKARRLDRP